MRGILRNGVILRSSVVVMTIVVSPATSWACPLCDSPTGEQVRAGIFNEDFVTHVVLTLLPFPVLFGVVALLYFDVPWRRPPTTPESSSPAASSSSSDDLGPSLPGKGD